MVPKFTILTVVRVVWRVCRAFNVLLLYLALQLLTFFLLFLWTLLQVVEGIGVVALWLRVRLSFSLSYVGFFDQGLLSEIGSVRLSESIFFKDCVASLHTVKGFVAVLDIALQEILRMVCLPLFELS